MMQNINEMPYMKYLIDGLPPELIKKAEIELGESEDVRAEALKELRSLVKSEPDLNACMEDAFLLRFLRCKKYRVDKAFKTLKNFYTYKATYSGILTDFRPSDIMKFFEVEAGTALEYRDSTYAGVGIVRLGQIDSRELSLEGLVSAILVGAEYGTNMESTQVAGYSLILDFEGIAFRTLKEFGRPTFLYRWITCVQDVMPCRIKGYHVVNQPYYFNIILAVARTFMSEKFSNRVHLHGNDLQSLYKHVPQYILPEELGGCQGPMSKFMKVYSQTLLSAEDHFIKMNKFGYQGKTLERLQKGNPHAIPT